MSNEKEKTEITKEEIAKEVDPKAVGEGNSLSALEKATEVLQRITEQNDRSERILKEQQKLEADKLLAGRSNAVTGQQPVETEDEKWEREAKVRYEGTGMDPTPERVETK